MPQQIIVDADQNVQVIETGPQGPPGVPGTQSDVLLENEVRITTIVIRDGSTTFPPGTSIDDFINAPTATPIGLTAAVVGFGPNYDGIYEGQTINPNDPETWGKILKIGELPSKLLISAMYLTDLSVDPISGLWITLKDPLSNYWSEPKDVSGDHSEPPSEVPNGTHLVDLLAAQPETNPPNYTGNGDDLFDSSGGMSNFPPLQYFPVDFSVLPSGKETLVLRIPDGMWCIVPTAWPQQTRAPWSLNIAFETTMGMGNLVQLGLTVDEVSTWGFPPSGNDVTITYHSTWGE